MRWNEDEFNKGYTVSHIKDADVERLHGMVEGITWEDCEAFLKGCLAAQLFPEKIEFGQLLAEISRGEYGDIEGSCNAYESRYFQGSLIRTN